MRSVAVIQHTEAEYLGLIEDHLEGRNIRFRYHRPFASGGTLPLSHEGLDGLVLLGGGPYGMVSGHILPSLSRELRLASACLEAGTPVIGIGLGALILAVAGGGGAIEAPLRFDVIDAVTDIADPPGAALPGRFPLACYLRDRPVLPEQAETVATGADGDPLLFVLNRNSIGFVGPPGFKRGMAEDLIMEFAETPQGTAATLATLADRQADIAAALSQIMVFVIARTGWMQPD